MRACEAGDIAEAYLNKNNPTDGILGHIALLAARGEREVEFDELKPNQIRTLESLGYTTLKVYKGLKAYLKVNW